MWVADSAQIPSCCGCGLGRRATAPIGPLAWEPPYAAGVAQEKAKRPKEKKGNLGERVFCMVQTDKDQIEFR